MLGKLSLEGRERGKGAAFPPMIHRVVQVLETNISWFFDEPADDESVIFRKGTRPFITLDKHKGTSRGLMHERSFPTRMVICSNATFTIWKLADRAGRPSRMRVRKSAIFSPAVSN